MSKTIRWISRTLSVGIVILGTILAGSEFLQGSYHDALVLSILLILLINGEVN